MVTINKVLLKSNNEVSKGKFGSFPNYPMFKNELNNIRIFDDNFKWVSYEEDEFNKYFIIIQKDKVHVNEDKMYIMINRYIQTRTKYLLSLYNISRKDK